MTAVPLFNRSLFVPEVIQTSAMDCGAAALYSTLAGCGVRVDYDDLRERCHTDVDGASIDTLEELAVELGLDAQQTIIPADHLFLDEARALPAIVVVRLPSGSTHFVVLWRRHGQRVQVMDPGARRHLAQIDDLRSQLFIHTIPFAPDVWRQWADENDFHEPVRRRIVELGVAPKAAGELVAAAVDATGWFPLAALDAATRFVHVLIESGAFRRGNEAQRALRDIFERALAAGPAEWRTSIPASLWSAFPVRSDSEEEQIAYRGAVLVRFVGHLSPEEAQPVVDSGEARSSAAAPGTLRRLFSMAWLRNRRLLPLVAAGLTLGAFGGIVEAMLFRAIIAFSGSGAIPEQAIGAVTAVLLFALIGAATETSVGAAMLRVGSRLEADLRIALLTKLPRLRDSYLQTRLRSDMAERCHSVSPLRQLPEVGAQVTRALLRLSFVTAAICWIAPNAFVVAVLVAVVAAALPFAVHPVLAQADMRARTHAGALTRFYLDALLGLVPLRAHGAAGAIRTQHEELLAQWRSAVMTATSTSVAVQGLQLAVCFAGTAWIVVTSASGAEENRLLLVYWAMSIPALAIALSQSLRVYPRFRSVGVRIVELLQAPERDVPEAEAREHATGGVRIELAGVSVHAAGQTILSDLDLRIDAGEHVAVVGSSGAGKSTLVSLILGWSSPATGSIEVDGRPLDDDRLQQLRSATAWVDPAVQLWNRSLLQNLEYGNAPAARPTEVVLRQAELLNLLEALPAGLQTKLGESGALMSGGEGQRVRFGRALGRPGTRLVILDEAFRGLDRTRRTALLARARD